MGDDRWNQDLSPWYRSNPRDSVVDHRKEIGAPTVSQPTYPQVVPGLAWYDPIKQWGWYLKPHP